MDEDNPHVAELELRVDELTAQKDAFGQKALHLQEENTKLREVIAALEMSVNRLKAFRESLEESNAQFQEENQELKKYVENLKEKVGSLGTKFHELARMKSRKALQYQIYSLQDQLKKAKNLPKYVNHAPNCGCEAEDLNFECENCQLTFGSCLGCADEHAHLCDRCWAAKYYREQLWEMEDRVRVVAKEMREDLAEKLSGSNLLWALRKIWNWLNGWRKNEKDS